MSDQNNSNHNNQVFLTKDGFKDLQEELNLLQKKKRPKLIKRVARARSFGDLSENAEYSNAREELAFIEGRIEELEELIAKAKVIRDQGSGGKRGIVGLGCKVTLRVGRKEHIYEVVGEWEADPIKKKISHNSPLGKALLGKKKGDKVEIEAPAGRIIYEIKRIH